MQAITDLLSGACGRSVDVEFLIKESPYLKHEGLRDWLGYLMMRRVGEWEMANSVEFAGMHVRMMRTAFDHDRMNALFAAERATNPKLAAWLDARHVSTYTVKDLAAYPEGSFGAMFHRHVVRLGLNVDLGFNLPTNTDFDYWILRGLQFHDLEHLLGGGGFDPVGEIMPAVMRHASLLRHLSPELAGALNIPTFFLSQSQLSSCMLYTPAVYPVLFERFNQAWRVGWTSGPYFMGRFEDYFHLPLAEARRALEMNNVDELDTTAMGEVMLGRLVA
jgi:ubiquinone biosynthesis protein COQ4